MKKLILILTLFLLACGIGFCEPPKKDLKPSDYRLGVSYTYAISQTKPFVLYFYTDWCPYCKNFMPKIKLVEAIYSNSYNIVMINCEDPFYNNVKKDYFIPAYPTVYLVDRKTKSKVYVDSSKYEDFSLFRQELDKFLEKK